MSYESKKKLGVNSRRSVDGNLLFKSYLLVHSAVLYSLLLGFGLVLSSLRSGMVRSGLSTACMALDPAKSEPNVAVKRIKYCLAVTRAITAPFTIVL